MPGYSSDEGVTKGPGRGNRRAEMGSQYILQPFRLVEEQLHRRPPVVGALLVFVLYPGKTDAVGTDVLERGANSRRDTKQAESGQSLTCAKHSWELIDRWRTPNTASVS